MNELFAHTIGRIDVIAGMVRIELVALVPSEGENAKAETRHVVILPLQGFVETFGAMNNMVEKLAAAGVLARKPAEAAAKKA